MQVYLENMLCQSVYIYQGNKELAQQYLQQLETALQGTGVSFPTDNTAIIGEMANGNCKQAAQLLAAANTSEILISEFESKIGAKNTPFAVFADSSIASVELAITSFP